MRFVLISCVLSALAGHTLGAPINNFSSTGVSNQTMSTFVKQTMSTYVNHTLSADGLEARDSAFRKPHATYDSYSCQIVKKPLWLEFKFRGTGSKAYEIWDHFHKHCGYMSKRHHKILTEVAHPNEFEAGYDWLITGRTGLGSRKCLEKAAIMGLDLSKASVMEPICEHHWVDE